MYFKVERGSDIFNEVSKVWEHLNKVYDAAAEVVREAGGDSWIQNTGYLAGGVSGIVFKEQPKDWKEVYKNQNTGSERVYYPYKNRKSVADIRDKISSLPVVQDKEINVVLDFKPALYMRGGRSYMANRPHVVWGDDVFIYSISEAYVDTHGYNPPEGAEEITKTEFDEIRESIHKEHQEEA